MLPRPSPEVNEITRKRLISEECDRLYENAGRAVRENGEPVSSAWLYDIVREVAERHIELSAYDLPGAAINWNFATMLYLVRWTWRTLEPRSTVFSRDVLKYAPWNKPPSELTQTEFRDSLHALAVRWSTLIPDRGLWEWLDALDRRAADLCVRSDLGDELDEDHSEEAGMIYATDEFVVDVAAILADMWRTRVVHRNFLRQVTRIYPPPRDLPVDGFNKWMTRERSRLTVETRETIDEDLSKHGLRPGEMSRYARSHLGVVPDDARVVLRFCRPLLSDYRKERPMEIYLIFDCVCRRHAFDWMPMALLEERSYFGEVESGLSCRDVMFDLTEPVILRIMGTDYVYHAGRAWRCDGPAEALCLWVSLVSIKYRVENRRWDLGFLKELYRVWTDGERVTETKPVFV